MEKYYTRACNFYFNKSSQDKVKQGNSLPFGNNKKISFDTVEIITRTYKKKINVKDINKLPSKIKRKVSTDIKRICKAKEFTKLKFDNIPILMGVLNITPDSFSDGGEFIKIHSAKKQIEKLITDGAKIIDVGGESTRPGSKEILQSKEWDRIKNVIKFLKLKKIFVSLDSRKSFVMKKATTFKINLINDVSGLNYDKNTITFLKKK
jgi:Dihydropteroate synthase and related enzymes